MRRSIYRNFKKYLDIVTFKSIYIYSDDKTIYLQCRVRKMPWRRQPTPTFCLESRGQRSTCQAMGSKELDTLNDYSLTSIFLQMATVNWKKNVVLPENCTWMCEISCSFLGTGRHWKKEFELDLKGGQTSMPCWQRRQA